MALRKDILAVTTTAQAFGDAGKQDFIFQNHSTSTNDVNIDFQGYTADGDGFVLEPGQAITSKDLPEFCRQGPFSAYSSGTASLHVHFAKTRG